MTNTQANTTTIQMGGGWFFSLLFLLFLGLKLTDHIDWSWWWVTAPLWGPAALVFGLTLIFFIFAFIFAGIASVVKK